MALSEDLVRIIFGLKLKQQRSDKSLSLTELAKKSGLSVSYINEIEKGKKYPKTDKIASLSSALNVAYDKLVSSKLTKNLAPLASIFENKILSDLPLDLFGIDSNKLIEIIANAPAKTNAFIAAIIEIARNYDMTQEEFYFAAMRSYQESNENYFPELEKSASAFAKKFNLDTSEQITSAQLEQILIEQFNYEINSTDLAQTQELSHLRSVLIPGNKNTFLIHSTLSDSQKAFLFGRELGYQYLQLQDRAYESYMIEAGSFEQVLNNFKASYFSSALLIGKAALIEDIKHFIKLPKWDPGALMDIMHKYTSSPEMFMHRLTNILPKYFGLNNLFFLRFTNTHDQPTYTLTKELHLSQLHNPHATAMHEHYCRRWLSIGVLNELQQLREAGKYQTPVVAAQLSQYEGSENEYFLISMARPMVRTANSNCSVSIGFLLNKDLKKQMGFWQDPAIPVKKVNQTCERCSISDCKERAVSPTIVEKNKKQAIIEARLQELKSTFQ